MKLSSKTSLTGFALIMTLCLFVLSCNREVTHLELDAVDSLCNVEPREALELLEAYRTVIDRAPRSARMRYALLQTKARDKAFVSHTSDSVMKVVVEYYHDHGTANQQLEAMYYLGSVYRDMHDSPRALKWYLEASQWGEQHIAEVDSTVLRNVYAQLSELYSYQYDWQRSLEASKREYQLSKDTCDNPRTIMDLANGYVYAEQADSGKLLYDVALKYIVEQHAERQNSDLIASQLSQLAHRYSDQEQARKRVDILRQYPGLDSVYSVASALGTYYLLFGPTDSAIYYYRKSYQTTPQLMVKMRAARDLTHLFGKIGQKDSMYHYTLLFVELNDSLYRQQQWQQTKLVQNEFEYRRNREAEEEAFRQAAEAKQKLMTYGIVGLVGLYVLVLMMWMRERRARKVIQRQKTEIEQRDDMIAEKEARLKEDTARLEELDDILDEKQLRLQELDNLLNMRESEMDEMRVQLSRTMEINEDLSSRWDLEAKKREVVEVDLSEVKEALQKKAAGYNVGRSKKELIKMMFQLIDQTYPDFGTDIRSRIPEIIKDDLYIIYMKKLGLTTNEIAAILKIDRSTVYRHLQSLEEQLGN